VLEKELAIKRKKQKAKRDLLKRITNRWAYLVEDLTGQNVQEDRMFVLWILTQVDRCQYPLDFNALINFSWKEFRIDMEGITRYFDQEKNQLIAYEPLCSKGRLATKPTDPLKSNDQPHGVAVN
jgi:hypothetical protein